MPPSTQIPLQFPEEALSFDSMEITGANRGVCAAVRNVGRWPYHAFCLIGSVRSGLTTIAQAWGFERTVRVFKASDFDRMSIADVEVAAESDFAVDDVDTLKDAQSLLMAMSAAKRFGSHILLTAHTAPSHWGIQSPDLQSRLQAAPLAELPAPDEELMRARLRRAFSRSCLDLPKSVEDYLVTRLGLDYSLIEQTAEILAGASGERALTVPLAGEILGEQDETGDLFDGVDG